MTVSTENSRDTFTFDGVTTVFPFTFRINEEDKANIKLYEDGVLMSASLYTIAVNANGVGGTITFSSAPGAVSPDNTTGVAIRQLPYTQGFDIRDGEGFDEEAVENAFDKATILTQQLKDLIARSLSLPIASSISPNVDAPSTDKQVMYYDLATQTIKWTTAEALYAASGAGNGDIVGPGAVTDSAIVQFDGITGNLVKEGPALPTFAAGNANQKMISDGSGFAFKDEAITELTIASGSVTPTARTHNIDTEGDASADDLATIVATNIEDGGILIFRPVSAARVTTVKHGTGNILLAGDADMDLDDPEQVLVLVRNGSNFEEVIRSAAGAGLVFAESADKTPTFNSTQSAAHLQGSAPSIMGAYLRCTSSEYGYAVNDRVPLASISDVGTPYSYNMSLNVDATNFEARIDNNGIYVLDSSRVQQFITVAKWKLVMWGLWIS